MLGYEGGKATQLVDEDPIATAELPIVLAGARCVGDEASLLQCPGVELGAVTMDAPPTTGGGAAGGLPEVCSHETDVSVVCFNQSVQGRDGEVRLQGGLEEGISGYGRLEVFAHGFWSNVCSGSGFTPDAARVACRALGYNFGAALTFVQPYSRAANQVLFENIPVALAAVDCEGDEEALQDCQSADRFIKQCTNRTSSTVIACSLATPGCNGGPKEEDGAVRLRGGVGTQCNSVFTGFVEVFHNGAWGAVCMSRYSRNALVADVICRQIGADHGNLVDPFPPPPPDLNSDVYDATEDITVLDLVSLYEDDDLESVVESGGPASLVLLMDGPECRGPEQRLDACDIGNGFHRTDQGCGPQSAQLHVACRNFAVSAALEGVDTQGAEEGELRLVDEERTGGWATGRPEVLLNGTWGQVCSDQFGAPDAAVACRQLGYTAGTIVPELTSRVDLASLGAVPVVPPAAITRSGCAGGESRLLDCPGDVELRKPVPADSFLPGLTGRGCKTTFRPGLRIGCVAQPMTGPEEGSIRLAGNGMGTPDAGTGALEVFHAGVWGSICRGATVAFDDTGPFVDVSVPRVRAVPEGTADVACRELGFSAGTFEETESGMHVSPPWLSLLQCTGSEERVADCPRSDFGTTALCGPSLQLVCT
eukprot:jgi/Ulvmu1/8834/UM049_0014.1